MTEPLSNGTDSTTGRATTIGRVIAYGAFFAIGLVVLRFQWHILFDLDRSGLVQYYIESLLLVPPLAIFGCVRAFRSSDDMLKLLAYATITMICLQVLGEAADPPPNARDVLNGLDRVFGLLCLIAWPAGLVAKNWPARAALLGTLVVVVLWFSLSWNFKRQEITWSPPAPTQRERALFSAVERGDLSSVQSLIAEGTRVNALDGAGWGALMRAVDRADPAMVKLLLSHGANPNTRENLQGDRCAEPIEGEQCRRYMMLTGRTALMAAAARGNVEVLDLLLSAGANPLTYDAHGKTARDWALGAKKPEVAALLLAAEGRR